MPGRTAQPPGHDGAIAFLLDWLAARLAGDRLGAVGHRVVHGGVRLRRARAVTPAILADLERLVPLAPLHQPHNLLPIRTLAAQPAAAAPGGLLRYRLSSLPAACGAAFALPRELSASGVRRYGFHGLSYEYIASVLPQYDARAAQRSHRRPAPRQRGEHVCPARGQEHGHDHGLHRRRRSAHGYPDAAASTRACCSICWTSAAWTRARSRI